MIGEETFGLSESKFKFAYYWVNHKLAIKKAFVKSLIIIDFVIFAFFAYGMIKYFFLEWMPHQENMRQMTMNYIDYPAWHKHIDPVKPIFSEISMIPGTLGNYNFLCTVDNQNDDWMLKLKYSFKTETFTTKTNEFFVYPKEKKYLYELGVPSGIRPSNIELIVSQTQWIRVIGFNDYASVRHQFTVENVLFQSDNVLKVSDKSQISRVSFDVTNATPFDFWEVGFIVTLGNGQTLQGISYVGVSDFVSYEKRHVNLNLFGSYYGIPVVSIIPNVNIYDKGVFRPLAIRFDMEDEADIEIFSKQLMKELPN